ncbi:hypothetical protein CCMA1212_008682 [Trichoderma ghanense]|uniref:Uncharacterized protein n=1 Tax=Trichoderma ghanense TaxID=65468 RepID=A0ABY2GWE2_9HYPO
MRLEAQRGELGRTYRTQAAGRPFSRRANKQSVGTDGEETRHDNRENRRKEGKWKTGRDSTRGPEAPGPGRGAWTVGTPEQLLRCAQEQAGQGVSRPPATTIGAKMCRDKVRQAADHALRGRGRVARETRSWGLREGDALRWWKGEVTAEIVHLTRG